MFAVICTTEDSNAQVNGDARVPVVSQHYTTSKVGPTTQDVPTTKVVPSIKVVPTIQVVPAL